MTNASAVQDRVNELNDRFGNDHVKFSSRDALVMIDLRNHHGEASLTTFGGTLLSYKPRINGRLSDDLIWVSETALYDGQKPVRGGVPVCWPWFGSYDATALGEDASDASKKGHGIARYFDWSVVTAEHATNEATKITLALSSSEHIRKAWPHDFHLELDVTLGDCLELKLTGENRSDREWIVSEAFHTYFAVDDAARVIARGYSSATVIDKLSFSSCSSQSGDVQVTTPMETIHLGTTATQSLNDGRRTILIEREGAASSVLWNPGPEGVKAFADMPDDQYRHTLCAEVANVLEDAYPLGPGDRHCMTMRLSLDAQES